MTQDDHLRQMLRDAANDIGTAIELLEQGQQDNAITILASTAAMARTTADDDQGDQ